MTTSKLSVVFLLRRIGPYHRARFVELAKRVNLTAVETRPGSEEYQWNFNIQADLSKESFPTGPDPEYGLRGRTLATQIRRIFNVYSPDVVITTGWADHEYHAAVRESLRRKIPCVLISDSRFEDEPRRWHKELLKRLILKSYSTAVVAGTMSTNYLLKLGFSRVQIFKPWDVVDNDYFDRSRLTVAFHDRYFLCVSRFIPKKNIPTLIDAFATYRNNGGKRSLVLVGSGADEKPLRDKVDKLNIAACVSFPGFIQYEELPEYFGQALCLILPSTTDQWGLVVNEAMASALPVLVSNQCGCAIDLVRSGINGFTFDAQNIDELTQRLHQMSDQTEATWTQMGTRGKEMISSWSTSAFAGAIEKASAHAVDHSSFTNFAFIHSILAR